jgi:hypothetical protein
MKINPRNVRAIAGKEIYHLIRDFRSLYLAFAVPLLLILLFGYALSLDVENIETVVVDEEKTDLSRDFISRLGASSYFRIVAHLPNTAAVTEALDHGKATLAVIIPVGWTADLRADRQAVIQILLDGSDPNFAGIARTIGTDQAPRGRTHTGLVQRGPGEPKLHHTGDYCDHHHDCRSDADLSRYCKRVRERNHGNHPFAPYQRGGIADRKGYPLFSDRPD